MISSNRFPVVHAKIPRVKSRSACKLTRNRNIKARVKAGFFIFKVRQSSMIAVNGRAQVTKPFEKTVKSKTRFKFRSRKPKEIHYGRRFKIIGVDRVMRKYKMMLTS